MQEIIAHAARRYRIAEPVSGRVERDQRLAAR
jgi:hypothetical protein